MALTKATNSMIVGSSNNVLDFGAVGGGVDDTIACQLAIDSSVGGTLVFPEGYTFSSGALTLHSNSHYVIDGTIKVVSTAGDLILLGGSNLTKVRISGKGTLDGGKTISGYQGLSAVDLTVRTDLSPLQNGDIFYHTGIAQFKEYDGSAWSQINMIRTGIKLNYPTECIIEDITITNFILTSQPGIDGAGLWLEGDPDGTWVDPDPLGARDNIALRVKAVYNIGNGIVFGGNEDSKTENCVGSNNGWASGIAHTRGLRAHSIGDRADSNETSNITVNCEDSEIHHPVSTNSGYSGINIGHDSAASDASRTLLVGGVSEGNNYEGVSVAGSTDVKIIGTYINNNGANGGSNDRYGIRALSGTERLTIIGAEVKGSKNSGIYLQFGTGHRVESTKSHFNDRTGMLLATDDTIISDCDVFNNNQLGGSSRAGIQISGGSVTITDCRMYDDQGAPTQSYGALASSGLHKIMGGSITGNSVSATNVSGGAQFGFTSVSLGTDLMNGSLTLTAGNSTVVANNNALSPSRILLVPRDSAGILLNPYPASVVVGTSFTISHFTAGGTEAFGYVIL